MMEYMRGKYGDDKIKRFNAVRKELDPEDIFLNTAMKEFLDP